MTDHNTPVGLDLESYFAKLMERLRAIFPCDSGGIVLVNPETGELEPYTYYNLPEEISYFPLGKGLVGIVAQSGQSRLENDLSDDLRHSPNARAAITAPIRLDLERLGVILIESEQASFTERDLVILEGIADQVALACDLASVEENLVQREVELTASDESLMLRNEFSHLATSDEALELLLPKMAEYLANILGADACAMTLWDDVKNEPQRIAAYGIDSGLFLSGRNRPNDSPSLTEVMITTGQTYIYNEAQTLLEQPTPLIAEFGAHDLLAMPLIARGKPIGGVFLLHLTVGSPPFTLHDADQVASALDQIAMTIDNRLLLGDMEARLSEATVLLQSAQIASSSLALDGTLDEMLHLTQTTFGVRFGAFLLYNRRENALILHTGRAFGIPRHYEGMRFPANDPTSQIAIVFNAGSPYISNRIRRDGTPPLSPYAEMIESLGLQNVLAVPLRVQDAPMGVFIIANKTGEFTRAEGELLMAMGSHVAAMLRTKDLLDDTQERLKDTQALQHVAEITGSTLDLDDMLERAVREAASLMEADGALLMMPQREGGDAETLIPHAKSCFGIATQSPFMPLPSDVERRMKQAFQTGRPDLDNELTLEGKRYGFVIFPLNRRQMPLGVIGLIRQDDTPLDDAHVDMIRAIATQIATSMENTKLFATERKRADMTALVNQISQELSATLSLSELSQKIVNAIHTRFGYETVNLVLLDDMLGKAVCRATVSSVSHGGIPEGFSFSLAEGVIGLAMVSNEVQVIANLAEDTTLPLPGLPTPQMGSMLVLPLRYGNRILGALELMTVRIDGFDAMDCLVMENLAGQIAVTIENARLWDQVRRRLLEQSIVHQIGQDLTSILKYHDLVTAVVRHMSRALDTAVALLIVRDEDDQDTIAAEYRLSGAHSGNLPSMVGRAVRDLHPEVAQSVNQSVESRRWLITTRADAPSEVAADFAAGDIFARLIVPMFLGERVIGAVVWLETRESRMFSDEDVRLAQTLATQAAIALDNALLVEAMAARNVELSKANKLKSEFLASISHELRTPMNAINGYSEMLLRGIYGDMSHKQVDRVERILRNGRSLLALIDDLLDLSKIDAGKMELRLEALKLHDEVGAIMYNLESQAAAKGLRLTMEAPEDLPTAKADPIRLRQVITNLLSNALKFTKTGGVSVVLSLHPNEGSGDLLWVAVTDTGIGIRPEDHAIIFDEFRQADQSTTREFGGTGLGLAISRKLVQIMGGEIWLESEVGKGSTFTFSIPVG